MSLATACPLLEYDRQGLSVLSIDPLVLSARCGDLAPYWPLARCLRGTLLPTNPIFLLSTTLVTRVVMVKNAHTFEPARGGGNPDMQSTQTPFDTHFKVTTYGGCVSTSSIRVLTGQQIQCLVALPICYFLFYIYVCNRMYILGHTIDQHTYCTNTYVEVCTYIHILDNNNKRYVVNKQ